MLNADLAFPADFDGWRQAARAAYSNRVSPEDIAFTVAGEGGSLFAEPLPPHDPNGPQPSVPKAFVDLAHRLICHLDADRFVFAYRLLCRLQSEKQLLAIASDKDVIRAMEMEKAVRRDAHKMKAFVRFREVETPDSGKHYIAWFEPFHHIVERTAPFFARRFTGMVWTILTPERTAHWDGAELSFLPGASRDMRPAGDDMEDLWLTYYASIFNPARLKVKAMTAEMPKKYWANMPETVLVKSMIAGAEAAHRRMIETVPTLPGLRHEKMSERREAEMARETAEEPMLGLDGPDADGTGRAGIRETGSNAPDTIEAARRAATDCRACPLWEPATQTVFGKGPDDAPVIFVGEQPGDQEDIAGEPFIGPAGKVFDEALLAAGVDRSQAYVTNAVKHFKFTPRGKRRIHAKPNVGEIRACRWWLDLERDLIKPKLIVALGASAAQAVLGKSVTIRDTRSRLIDLTAETRLLVTVHPSYILRLPDKAAQERERGAFQADMALVLRTVPELALAG
ncbi:UdgX family uracil-DNA binding protein [Fulvimarina sp. 2208YS6-2-32]|uniref:Type-4 uracil-DNA glycosylase n=1 Tax=Fulvimarina uroteuthidis TaxID=3098149 RepID=A0ABU5I6J5_9HYPH|nr:UdgX family uracil-DNA binding protein [Fulvimarina sp. 2208YS6-2-32]MDY8111013.1 UdgX family uracil-DNA binding protein [Fulvimarina sp. 2208YS6-2-32]